jgi:hypothetical protein
MIDKNTKLIKMAVVSVDAGMDVSGPRMLNIVSEL